MSLDELYKICEVGDVHRAIPLLRAGARPTGSVGDSTPLHCACENGHTKLVIHLLKYTEDINTPLSTGLTPLHRACGIGFVEVVRVLCSNGANVEAFDSAGFTPLHHACSMGNVDVIEELIRFEADPNGKCQISGNSPLHVACTEGMFDAAKVLLQNGADVNSLNGEGLTPLFYAVRMNRYEILRELLQRGASVDVTSRDNWTALHVACHDGYYDVARALLESGAKTDVINSKGNVPIHYAARSGRCDLVELLVHFKADVNMIGNNGMTALHFAAYVGKPEIVDVLLEAGADTNMLTRHGKSPLDLAKKHNHIPVVHILECRGTKPKYVEVTPIIPLLEEISQIPVVSGQPLVDFNRYGTHSVAKSDSSDEVINPTSVARRIVSDGGDDQPVDIHSRNKEMEVIEDTVLQKRKYAHTNLDEETICVDQVNEIDTLPTQSSSSTAMGSNNFPFQSQLPQTHLREPRSRSSSDLHVDDPGAALQRDQELLKSSQSGNVGAVNDLILAGANVNASDLNGVTPLHEACAHGFIDVVRALLDAGADMNCMECASHAPLHYAIRRAQHEIVCTLLFYGADPDIRGQNGLTPLHWASFIGNGEIARVLLNAGANSEMKSDDGLKPLQLAEQRGSTAVIEVYASFFGTRPSVHEQSLREQSHRTESAADPAVCGAISCPSPPSNDSPMQSDTMVENSTNAEHTPFKRRDQGDSKSLRLPSEARPEHGRERASSLPAISSDDFLHRQVNETEQQLISAVKKGDIVEVTSLVHRGARVSSCTIQGDTPLHEAAASGFQDVLLFLIEAGADVNARNKNSNTPLHGAIRQRRAKIVRILIENGADIDARGFNGATPLHWASFVGDLEITRILLEEGAHPRLLTSDQKLPLVIAREKHHIEVATLLEKAPSRFYSVLFAKYEEFSVIELHSRLGTCVGDVHEMKIYYTLLRAHIAQNMLSAEEGRDCLKKALGVAATTCVTEDAVACFKVVLEKCRSDKLLDEVSFYKFDNRAEVHRMENSEFIQDMKLAIRKNTARIDSLEVAVRSIIENIKVLDENIRMVNSQVSDVKSAFRRKMKRDAAFGFVSCVLGVVGGGIIGSLCSVVSDVFNVVVDFGDTSHILDIIATQFTGKEADEMVESFQKGIEFGRKLLEQTNTYLTGKIVADAMKEGDALLVLGLTATLANPDRPQRSEPHLPVKDLNRPSGIYEDAVFPEEEENMLPLHAAVKFGNRKHLEDALLQEDLAKKINAKDSKGRTATDLAALTGQMELMQLLEVNGGKFRFKSAPRMEAIAEMRAKNVEQYLHHVHLQLES